MKSLNIDMNSVNCVLLLIVLILVLLFCNKQNEKYTDYIEKSLEPDCNKINPCENGEENESFREKCSINKYLYPLDIAKKEFKKPFKSGMSSVSAYLQNYKFKGLSKKDVDKKLNSYIKKIENKSCRKKNDNFCKLRFGDRYEINPSSNKNYLRECGGDSKNLWEYKTNDSGDEILSDYNGSLGSLCTAPNSKSCGKIIN